MVKMDDELRLTESAINMLSNVVDPELGINIWDLGLVYDLSWEDTPSGLTLKLTMTLTTPACPLSDVIEQQISESLTDLFTGYTIHWVWLPSWHAGRISDDGKHMLRALGFDLSKQS